MREPMQWSDQYLLGYPAMDRTHQAFVECVAALQTAADAELPQRLAAFAAHAMAHFEEEERWMAETAFPAAQCHADEHAAVLNSVREVQSILGEPGRAHVARDLTQALVGWFPGHADYMDAALSHWLAKRSFGGAPVVLKRGAAARPEAA
jgi:hemerythrin